MLYDNLDTIPIESAFIDAYDDSLTYSEVTWLTAHNAFANKEDGWKYAQQSMNLAKMFEYGVYSYMIDIHKDKGDLYLCHGSCTITIGQKFSFTIDKAEVWLKELYAVISNHIKQVITLHLETKDAPNDEIYNLFRNVGLDKFLLKTKLPNDAALTLGYMRKNDERLVVFSDYQYERKVYNRADLSGLKPGLFPTLNYKETEYSIEDYNDCKMRTDFRADPTNPDIKLVVFNHFSPVSIAKDYSNVSYG